MATTENNKENHLEKNIEADEGKREENLCENLQQGEAPTGDASNGDAPSGDALIGEVPTEDAPNGEAPTGDGLTGSGDASSAPSPSSDQYMEKGTEQPLPAEPGQAAGVVDSSAPGRAADVGEPAGFRSGEDPEVEGGEDPETGVGKDYGPEVAAGADPEAEAGSGAPPSAGMSSSPGAAEMIGGPDGGAGGSDGGRRGLAFRITLLIVLFLIVGIYFAGYQYGKTRFLPGTTINGHGCAGLTEEEVQAKFAADARGYALKIRFRGGSVETIGAGEMGLAYKPDGSIAELLQKQDRLFWPGYFLKDSPYEIVPDATYDPDLLEQALRALPELQKENMEEPKDAYIAFRDGEGGQDGRFEIVPDTEGSTIDLEQLAAGVGDAASHYTELVDAEDVAGAYVRASVRAEDAGIVARCSDLNDIVGASITYVLPDGEEMKLNSDVMKDWLVRDERGRLVRDDKVWDEKLWAFLEQVAYNANTIGMKRRFHSTLRGEITVSGGDYGYMMNQVVEHDKLMKDFDACTKETRKPEYYISPYNEETENDGIGTSYIEVDLAAQHIWCYIDGKLALESDCVSGNVSDGHATPTGVFGIMFMKKDATLRGIMQKDGEYEYETKVGYWMPFYAECGFHDAWWRTEFGGDIYLRDGSHGCINLPVDAAKKLFKYCDNKMPVVVYE